MSESKYPVCPICKQEVLLPFSISQISDHSTGKVYGSWICSNCGFYLNTRDTRAIDPESDFETGFNVYVRKKVEELREKYYKQRLKK
jgi:hypothetical protein